MKKLFSLSFAILNSYWSVGQICGTPIPSQVIIYPKEPSNARGTSSALCVDVFFHIVRNTDGTNAFTPPNLDNIVSNLNEVYTPHNIIINNVGSDFIDHTNYLTLDARNGSTEDDDLFSTNNISSTINFYIVEGFVRSTLVGKAESIPSKNLVMRSSDVLSRVSAHELGHCFNLLHTHKISEGVEAINGSNCQVAGDLICDTPVTLLWEAVM